MSTDVESTVVRINQNNRRVLVWRSLIAALVLFCMTCAYSFFLVIQFHSHVAAFQKQGADLETAFPNEKGDMVRETFEQVVGRAFIPASIIRYHRSLFAIYLRHDPNSNPEEIDELFRLLPKFSKLNELHFEGFVIDEDRAAVMARLPNLKGINLMGCQIKKSCLATLLQNSELTHIRLADSKFEEAELANLIQGEPNETLIGLSLSFCKVTDQSVSILSRCRKLEFLELDGTQITDQGLKMLARLPQLRILILDHTAVTDTGVGYLSSTPNLVELSLSNTSASDAMLETLKTEIPALRVSDD